MDLKDRRAARTGPEGGRTVASRATRVAVTPPILAYLGSPRLRDRPDRLLGLLQRIDPVHRSPFGFWLLSGHAEIEAALRDHRLGTDDSQLDLSTLRLGPLQRATGTGQVTFDGPFGEVSRDLMLFKDPPDHTRLRGLVSRAFTARRMQAIEHRIEAVADEALDDLLGRHRDGRRGFELMAELAYPFPAKVICELLGLPQRDHEFISRHGRDLAVGLDPLPTQASLRRADHAVAALRAHLEPVFADRREHPRDDLLSDLVGAADDGDRLTADELLATVILLLIAGHETTANLIGNGMVLLDRNPLQRARLRDGVIDPGIAVEELLRRDPPVQVTLRVAREALELGGAVVPKGSAVVLLLVAGNHDAAVFDDPHQLVLDRSNAARHLTFGGGAHYCLGAALARMEGRILLPRLLRTFPDLRVVERRPRHRSSFTIRGYEHLAVRTWPT